MMRHVFLLLALAASGAAPAAAQQVSVDRRVDRLEQEMRAVQRRVFPNGSTAAGTVDPEITAATRPQPTPTAAPGSDAVSSLTSRIEALEAQLARVTGQVEETGYRVRQLEDQVRQVRTDLEARLTRLEQAAAPPPAAATPGTGDTPAAETPPAAPGPETTPPAATGGDPDADAQPPAASRDPAEAAYNAGYRLWEQRRFAEAQQALTAAADRYSNSRWASWSRNLAGRAYLDDNKPATAARIFLSNYQTDPRGERAADSLYFLGEALVRLNRRSEACPVYDELTNTYPNMRAWLRDRLPAARRAAGCPAR